MVNSNSRAVLSGPLEKCGMIQGQPTMFVTMSFFVLKKITAICWHLLVLFLDWEEGQDVLSSEIYINRCKTEEWKRRIKKAGKATWVYRCKG